MLIIKVNYFLFTKLKYHSKFQNHTSASSRVEKGNAYSEAPGTRSSLASAPSASTNLAGQS